MDDKKTANMDPTGANVQDVPMLRQDADGNIVFSSTGSAGAVSKPGAPAPDTATDAGSTVSGFNGPAAAPSLSEMPGYTVPHEEHEVETIKESDYDKPAAPQPAAADSKLGAKKGGKEHTLGVEDDYWVDQKKKKQKKYIILGSIAAAIVAVFAVLLFWMFKIAPAAEIKVHVTPTETKFSANLKFTADETKANPKAGEFLLSTVRSEDDTTVEFDATGTANNGARASGTITIYFAISQYISYEDQNDGKVAIPKNTVFICNGNAYETTISASVDLDSPAVELEDGMFHDAGGRAFVSQDDLEPSTGYPVERVYSTNVRVEALEAGPGLNMAQTADTSMWSKVQGSGFVVYAYSAAGAISGGTDNNVKVVTEADVNQALSQITTNSSKQSEMVASVGDEYIALPTTFAAVYDEPVVVTPAGTQVQSGKGQIKVHAKYTMMVASLVEIEEYIRDQTLEDLDPSWKIYEMSVPTVKNTDLTKDPAVAKVQSTLKTGPDYEPKDLYPKALGRSVSQVHADLMAIDGIAKVDITTNYPWVSKIPSEQEKVKLTVTVEK